MDRPCAQQALTLLRVCVESDDGYYGRYEVIPRRYVDLGYDRHIIIVEECCHTVSISV
jgi:hypothetical protein